MKKLLRPPTTPGEILQEEFLKPLALTQKRLADHVGCDVKGVNRIVNGRSSVTADMAVRLGAALGTTAEFWLNAQQAVDLYRASGRLKGLPRSIRPPCQGLLEGGAGNGLRRTPLSPRTRNTPVSRGGSAGSSL